MRLLLYNISLFIGFFVRGKGLENIHDDFSKQVVSGLHYPFMKMMRRYAKHLVETLFPKYENHLIGGRTSCRPEQESHAVLAGQYLLKKPVHAMQNSAQSHQVMM